MDHLKILKRALDITWKKRALWLFGILFALASGGTVSGGFRGYSFSGQDVRPEKWLPPAGIPFGEFLRQNVPGLGIPGATVGEVILFLGIVLLVWGIVSAFIRYLARNALIRMVAQVEETQGSITVGEGFRLAWSRPAWKMFLIDLELGIPFFLASLILLALAASPLLLLLLETVSARVVGIGLTAIFLLVVIALLIAAGIFITVLAELAYRETALSGKGARDAVRGAFEMLRGNMGDVAIIWLLVLAIGIGWGLVMIPVFIVLLLLAGLIGGIPAYLIHQITQNLPLTLLVGIPLGGVVLFVPLLFLGGLYHTFISSVWTLAYRELLLREVGLLAEEPPAPEPDAGLL